MSEDSNMKTEFDVAYRALALMAICYRASSEQAARRNPDAARAQKIEKIRAWAEEQGIDDHFSDFERDTMDAPLGEIEDDEELGALGWRLQSMVAALWAVGMVDPMPTYARSVAAQAVQPLMPLGKPVDQFLTSARIRPDKAIQKERTRAQFWTWRARCEAMRRRGVKPPPGKSYQVTIREAAQSALSDGLIDALADDDVACDGRAYHRLDDREFSDAASTALERLYLLNWICGESDDWDTVPTDT